MTLGCKMRCLMWGGRCKNALYNLSPMISNCKQVYICFLFFFNFVCFNKTKSRNVWVYVYPGLSNCVDHCSSRHSCSPLTTDIFTCAAAPASTKDCERNLNRSCLNVNVDFAAKTGFVR